MKNKSLRSSVDDLKQSRAQLNHEIDTITKSKLYSEQINIEHVYKEEDLVILDTSISQIAKPKEEVILIESKDCCCEIF